MRLSMEELEIADTNLSRQWNEGCLSVEKAFEDLVALESAYIIFTEGDKLSYESYCELSQYVPRAMELLKEEGTYEISFEDDEGFVRKMVNGGKSAGKAIWNGAVLVKNFILGSKLYALISKLAAYLADYLSEKLQTLYYDLKNIKLDKLYYYKDGLEYKKFDQKIGTMKGGLLKKLAFFDSLGYTPDARGILEFTSLPYELIVKKKIFSDILAYAGENLLSKKYNEKDLPVNTDTVDLIRHCSNEEIKSYIDKITKFVLPNTLFTNRPTIMKINQSPETGTIVTNKSFNIKSRIEDGIETFSLDDSLTLINHAIELGKQSHSLEYDHMKVVTNKIKESLKQNQKDVITKAPLAYFNYRRFMKGLANSVLGMKRSHLQSIALIEYMVKSSVKKI